MVLQNLTGISVAALFGLPAPVGLLGGTVSLIGGHGAAIAWAPRIAEDYGIANAMEIGIACATFGLILASLMGGLIAKFLIHRHALEPAEHPRQDVGVSSEEQAPSLTSLDFLDAILAIHISIIVGLLLNRLVETWGLQLPTFVTCLFAGILLTNLAPKNFPRISRRRWPTRTPAIALIADIALGTFRLPRHGVQLRRRRDLLRFRRYLARLHADRHGQHGRSDSALRRFASGFHHRAAGVRLFH
jgi:ESS family glutamate:Na+ symporter